MTQGILQKQTGNDLKKMGVVGEGIPFLHSHRVGGKGPPPGGQWHSIHLPTNCSAFWALAIPTEISSQQKYHKDAKLHKNMWI